jgi:hypothetical protein
MLGLYENFPATVHRAAHFSSLASNKRLQQKLAETLRRLNAETVTLESVTDPSIPRGTVNFDFGIGEASNFNYLDSEEAARLLKAISGKPLQIMDFFCAARYHRSQSERQTRLRFDYYMLRFKFNEDSMKVYVFHERGPRYTSPEDIISLIVNRINEASAKKILAKTH